MWIKPDKIPRMSAVSTFDMGKTVMKIAVIRVVVFRQ